ncbi:MAG: hypothetical protein JRG94_15470 [Deltaproteobacteria bacterium]|nr:hypothetical protein [Deltaproteobacteria bacterium]
MNYLKHSRHPHPLAANVQIDPWGVIVAEAVARSMEAFVVAHEAAHVLLGHHHETRARSVITPYGQLDSIARSHQDEFAADRWAEDAMLQLDQHGERVFAPRACGGLCFLTVHRMVLEVHAKLDDWKTTPDRDTESHPSSLRRVDAMREWLSSRSAGEDLERVLWLWALLARFRGLIAASSFEVTESGIAFPDSSAG